MGWEVFTDAIICALNARSAPLVFCFWGNEAKKKTSLIDMKRNAVVVGAHPSPLSRKGFLGSKPFSAINKALEAMGQSQVDWVIK